MMDDLSEDVRFFSARRCHSCGRSSFVLDVRPHMSRSLSKLVLLRPRDSSSFSGVTGVGVVPLLALTIALMTSGVSCPRAVVVVGIVVGSVLFELSVGKI